MPVTMRDIARDVGVSTITVSKVLRNHEDISEKTRKRVLDRVKELNYTPNLAARGLATGRTYLVGLVVTDLLHTYFAEVAKSLAEALLKKGYGLIISTTEEDPKLERRIVDQVLGRRLDALVIVSACATAETYELLQQMKQPFVLVDRRFPELDANYVGADDELIGTLATEHLIDVGCKRIAHLRGPDISPGIGRLHGYLKTMAKHHLDVLPGYVSVQRMADVNSKQSGEYLMKELLKLSPRPDGIFAFNDPMAIGAIHAILDAGLRVPEDIAVIGSGNLHYDTDLRVPLTSIDQKTALIGQSTARLILSLLESKTRPRNKTIMIEPELVVRASTDRKKARHQSKSRKSIKS
jgi:LacI family transcriptional regulator